MTRWQAFLTVVPLALALLGGTAIADVDPYAIHDLQPLHDTWATHNDDTVHGDEEIIRVGIEPQQCVPGGWDPCEEDDMECCVVDDGYNYCAAPGQCGSTEPVWGTYRKFRGYIRFDLSGITEGIVEAAYLDFKPVRTVSIFGGDVEVEVYRLKKIGEAEICYWDEGVLDDTNLTTWSSLPQNVSVTPEGRWRFDVTKAARDWLEGDPDQGGEIQPNCGFHLADPNFGRRDAPLARWIDFSSKEGTAPPILTVRMALDLDEDGYYADCDEEDASINPGATESCDGVDNDCDGATDEEDCDGIDNDCDGTTDEGDPVAMCGPGRLCVAHECVDQCEDECRGPTDLECRLGDDGVWERWACGDVDDDPCRDRYFVSDCDADEFCEFGYCSGNCVDLCEPEEEGLTDCYEDELDRWYLATCGEWDDDGCLEWGNLQPCGPAATCVDGACQGGCTDGCTTFGAAECVDDATVRMCYDADGDGCLEWVETETCATPDAVCEDGLCVPVATCEDECTAGETRCDVNGGEATLSSCVLDTEEPCYVWHADTPCPYGCDAAGTGCAAAPPDDIGQPDVVQPPADVVTPPDDVAQPPDDTAAPPEDGGQPSDDTATGSDTAAPPEDSGGQPKPDAGGQPGVDAGVVLDLSPIGDGGTGGSGGDGGGSSGCQAGATPGSSSAPFALLGLLAALGFVALRRRQRAV